MVREGYKRTEVGVIPEEWEVVRLGDIGQLEKGRGIRKTDLVEYGLACIRYAELYTQYHDIITQYTSSISLATAKSSRRLNRGDVLFACSGETKEEIGKSAVVLSDKEAYAGSDMIILSPSVNLDFAYLGYALNSKFVTDQKSAAGQGDAVVHISTAAIANLLLPLPPLPEQRRIARVLSDVDDLLAGLDAVVAKKEGVKRGVMEELLEKRLSKPENLFKLKVTQLGEISDIKTGSRNNQDKDTNGDYPFFVRSQTVEKINTFSYDCEAILVPGEGNIGSIFHYIDGKFEVHQRVYKISNFAEGVFGRFIYFYIKYAFGRHALDNSVKATVDSLRLPTFQNFPIPLPPLPEQRAIAEVLTALDEELAALRARRAKVAALRAGLLEDLLGGRVRV